MNTSDFSALIDAKCCKNAPVKLIPNYYFFVSITSNNELGTENQAHAVE